jgi:hypothetical protein
MSEGYGTGAPLLLLFLFLFLFLSRWSVDFGLCLFGS